MADVTNLVDWEVAWWRSCFVPRFCQGELPKVGEPTLGYRMKVYVERPDGTFVPWSERHVA